MIKHSTIEKREIKKKLPLVNHQLKKEMDQRGADIKTLAEKLVQLSAMNDKLLKEIRILKSHWAYKITHWK